MEHMDAAVAATASDLGFSSSHFPYNPSQPSVTSQHQGLPSAYFPNSDDSFKAIDLFAEHEVAFGLSSDDPTMSSSSSRSTIMASCASTSPCSSSSSSLMSLQGDSQSVFTATATFATSEGPCPVSQTAHFVSECTPQPLMLSMSFEGETGLPTASTAMAISPSPSCSSSPASSEATPPSSPSLEDVVLPVVACASCKKSHIKCDHGRPCQNCLKHPNKALSCQDAVPKPRGRPKGGSKAAAEQLLVATRQPIHHLQQVPYHDQPMSPAEPFSPHHQQQYPRQRAMSYPHIIPAQQPHQYLVNQQQYNFIQQPQQPQIQQAPCHQRAISHPQLQQQAQTFEKLCNNQVLSPSPPWASASHVSLPSEMTPPVFTRAKRVASTSSIMVHPQLAINGSTTSMSGTHSVPVTPSEAMFPSPAPQRVSRLNAHEYQQLQIHHEQVHRQQKEQNEQQQCIPGHQSQQSASQQAQQMLARNPHDVGMTRSMSDQSGPRAQGRQFLTSHHSLQLQPVPQQPHHHQQILPTHHQHSGGPALAMSSSSSHRMVVSSAAQSPVSSGSFATSPSSLLPPTPPNTAQHQQQFIQKAPVRGRAASASAAMTLSNQNIAFIHQQYNMQLHPNRSQAIPQAQFPLHQEFAQLNVHHHQQQQFEQFNQLQQQQQQQQQQEQHFQQHHLALQQRNQCQNELHQRTALQSGLSSIASLSLSRPSSGSLSTLHREDMEGVDT